MARKAIPNYRLYQEKTDESADFWLHCETLSVRSGLHNWEIAVHRHSALFQIFWVSEGKGMLIGGGREDRPFAAPCVLFIPPGAAHGFRFAEGAEGLVTTVLADRLSLPGAADRTLSAFLAETRIIPLGEEARRRRARGSTICSGASTRRMRGAMSGAICCSTRWWWRRWSGWRGRAGD